MLALFLQYMAQALILEQQRVGNNILEYNILQALEAQVHTKFKNLTLLPGSTDEVLGFIPDTLEANNDSGVTIAKFKALLANQPTQLLVTYSIR